MGRLITITGISGAGKTTFASLLAQRIGAVPCLEQLSHRPFHTGAANGRSMLANQLDFFLYRAEQERAVRLALKDGVTDGGLETDYHVYSRLFHQRRLLTDVEFYLCARYYRFYRNVLPPPEWIIHLKAPVDLVAARFKHRSRKLEVSRLEDLECQQNLIADWLANEPSNRVLTVDAAADDAQYSHALKMVLRKLRIEPNSQKL